MQKTKMCGVTVSNTELMLSEAHANAKLRQLVNTGCVLDS